MGEYWILVFLVWVFVVPFLPPFDKLPAGTMMMICIGGVMLRIVYYTSTLPPTDGGYVPLSSWAILFAVLYGSYLLSYVDFNKP